MKENEKLQIERLEELVTSGKWSEARILADALYEHRENSQKFWILNASIYQYEKSDMERLAAIYIGLHQSPSSYELYYMLGNYYFDKNINQAYLCYENALFYCDEEEDFEVIRTAMKDASQKKGFRVRNFSIVILSYNIKEVMIGCIESIRKNNLREAYELVVVDNASSDGVSEWLKKQKDIVLRCNSENAGFAGGCNQGIELANINNDILLLNNDTIVLPNSLFWLRMGLYERASVGAVGPLTNFAPNGQELVQTFETKEGYIENAKKINAPMLNQYENKLWLVGFAMLISRNALNDVGVLDTRYEWGNSEDTDYGLALGMAGYENILCYNSFIYHYGSLNMAKDKKKYMDYLYKNTRVLVEKWRFEVTAYTQIKSKYIEKISEKENKDISILEIGCGCGTTLARIRHLYPVAKIYGVENNPTLRKFGCVMGNTIFSNIVEIDIDEKFDYIFVSNNSDELNSIQDSLESLLKTNGKIVRDFYDA